MTVNHDVKQRDLETKGFGNKGIWKQRDLETKGFGNQGLDFLGELLCETLIDM